MCVYIYIYIYRDIYIYIERERERESMVTEMVYLGFSKGLSKKQSLEVGFELVQSGAILQTSRQRISDR